MLAIVVNFLWFISFSVTTIDLKEIINQVWFQIKNLETRQLDWLVIAIDNE